jgi:hypothetical protein
MPAFLLILRTGRMVIPLPWFLVWLILLPFGILAWLAGLVASLFSHKWEFRALTQALRILYLLMSLSGTRCDVSSEGRRFAVAWF